METDAEKPREADGCHRPTPEELRWRAGADDPDKAHRMLKYQYILLAIWFGLLMGWVSHRLGEGTMGDWWQLVALALGGIAVLLGIVNNKRIIRGKKPWGDF